MKVGSSSRRAASQSIITNTNEGSEEGEEEVQHLALIVSNNSLEYRNRFDLRTFWSYVCLSALDSSWSLRKKKSLNILNRTVNKKYNLLKLGCMLK